jgi:arginase
MAAAAWLDVPYPEASVVEEETLEAQVVAQVRNLPALPLVLGGCCCAHIGAIRALASRPGRLGIVWMDAHGDLNTPQSSPSGNAWGMPLRSVIDAGAVQAADVALVGARCLDPPELAYLEARGIDDDLGRALAGCDHVYVALDCDVLRPGEVSVFMPEAGGPSVAEVETLLRDVVQRYALAGMGLTGLRADAEPSTLLRLTAAAGL